MSLFFGKQPDPHPLPPWLKVAIVLFVLYSVFLSVTGKNPTPVENNQALQSVDWGKQFNWEEYKAKVLPDLSAPMRLTDEKIGSGSHATCGQDVTFRYRAFLPDGKQVDGNWDSDTTLSATLGANTIIPALEKGIIGMQVGGVRTIATSPDMAYGAVGWAKDNPDLAQYMMRFEVELKTVTPDLALPSPVTHLNLRSYDETLSVTGQLGCGDSAPIRLAVYKSDGQMVYSNMDEKLPPLTIRLGASQAPLGLEQGLIGLSPDRRRTLIVPPYLTGRLRAEPLVGEQIPPQISLPENESLVMDIVYISPSLLKKE